MRLVRRTVVAALAAAQLAVVAIGPLIDAPPQPAGHQPHLAAGTEGGCHPYHDDHCVVCRGLSTEAVRGAAPVVCSADPQVAFAALPAPSHAAPGDPAAPRHARGPPA